MAKAVARMVTKEVSKSKKLPNLSPDALNLFFMLIPHFDCHGKMHGDPHYIKGEVVPRFDRFTPRKIGKLLEEITELTNVKWFQIDGLWYIHSLNFREHQPGLREDRGGEDTLPSYPIENIEEDKQLRTNSGLTPDLLPPEGEVEVEVKRRSKKGEGEGVRGVSPRTHNLTDEEFIQKLKDSPAYKHIDIDHELARMDVWLLTPKGKGRQKTRRFIVSWLSKIDRPINLGATKTAANKGQAETEARARAAALKMAREKLSKELNVHPRDVPIAEIEKELRRNQTGGP